MESRIPPSPLLLPAPLRGLQRSCQDVADVRVLAPGVLALATEDAAEVIEAEAAAGDPPVFLPSMPITIGASSGSSLLMLPRSRPLFALSACAISPWRSPST